MLSKEKIVKELEEKYLGKNIICYPEDKPTEIICEVEPTQEGKDSNWIITVVGKSAEHVHYKTTEVYTCLKGELTVYIDDKRHILKEGESLTIIPGTVHYAEGNEAWFKNHSTPGWTLEDHIVIEK